MDQTDVRLAASVLLESDLDRELLRAYIDSANDGIFVVCDEMKFVVANRRLASWFGISEAELVRHGQRFPILDYLGRQASVRLFQEQFQRVLAGAPVRFELELAPAGAGSRWVEISLNRVDVDALMVIGVMRDVTERRQLIETMTHYASHDDLTGLCNRREFQRQLKDLFNDARNSSVQHVLMYIDLDQFKIVNDNCGHQAGDELMCELAGRVQRHMSSDNILARLGGDEFGALITDCSVDRALQIAEDIRDSIAAFEFLWGERSFRVSASIGVCAIDSKSESPESLMSAADAACYVAKDKGRNRVQLFFGGDDCTRKRKEMEWVPRIEQALKDDRLELHYQKIISLKEKNRQPCAYLEVLLRLVDESGALVPPGAFFPSAERYNMMPAIDRWVVKRLLLDQPDYWMGRYGCGAESGPGAFHVGINLSGASINDDAFIAFLEDALNKTKVPHSSICFEITETVAISNLARATEVMHAIREKGCRFALDDFGKGMSSFGYLRSLPVDYLKIDGTLVKAVMDDDVACTMVEAINRIAYAMDIETIAEFVENDRLLNRLRAIGVDYAQGFGIHVPEPLRELFNARDAVPARHG
jgi:diguanylate cyclase (GGDEF)-like protein/PAS domain S-box-containing protein